MSQDEKTEDRASGPDSLGRASNVSSDERPENEEPDGIGCEEKDYGHET